MTNHKKNHVPALIADIGGTHIRFARTDDTGTFGEVSVLTCADHTDLYAAVTAYLTTTPTIPAPKRAAFAIACTPCRDRVQMTNLDWAFSCKQLRHQLNLDHLEVINDFTAIAHAVPHLTAQDLRQIGSGKAQADSPVGILGPGTGLGISALIPAPRGAIALQTEGGHATLAASTDVEAQVIEILRRRFGHASAERALSGPGLVNLYEALAAQSGAPAAPLTPAQVTAQGLANPESICGQAVEMFCTLLGTVAADLALTLGAHGGIYIAGGIVGKLGAAFDTSGFRQRFQTKGRFSAYLADIPTSVITHPQPALVGLSQVLKS